MIIYNDNPNQNSNSKFGYIKRISEAHREIQANNKNPQNRKFLHILTSVDQSHKTLESKPRVG